MAYPQVQSYSSGVFVTANSATHTLTMPTGIQAGDLLIAFISMSIGTDGHLWATINAGSSSNNWWGPLGNDYVGDTGWRWDVHTGLYMAYAYGSGNDSLTVNTAWSAYSRYKGYFTAYARPSFVVYRISGAAYVPEHVLNIARFNMRAGDNASWYVEGPSPDDSVVTDYLWLATIAAPSNKIATAAPTNFTNLITAQGSDLVYLSSSLSTCRREYNAASSLTTGAFTSPSSQWIGYLVRVSPSNPGPPPTGGGGIGMYINKQETSATGNPSDYIDGQPTDIKFHYDGTYVDTNPFGIYIQVTSTGNWTSSWSDGTHFYADPTSGTEGVTYVSINCYNTNTSGSSYLDTLTLDGPGTSSDTVYAEQYTSPL